MKKDEIVKNKKMERTGICKYCNQVQFVEASEHLTPEQVNNLVTEKCECVMASIERKKKERMKAAGNWAKETFGKENEGIMVYVAIKAVFDNKLDSITIKNGRKTYKIDQDREGMIRIKTTYKASDTQEF